MASFGAEVDIGADDDEFIQEFVDENRSWSHFFQGQRVPIDRTRLLEPQVTLQAREAEGVAADGVDGVDERLQANVAVEVFVHVGGVIVEMRTVFVVKLTAKPTQDLLANVGLLLRWGA